MDTKRQVAIEAKYLRPRIDNVSLRADTARALAAAFKLRLTVVCAPAGYGKTTTTAAALEQCGRVSSWYKLDVLDHDPLAFLAAITRAVQRVYPGFGEELLRELESGPASDLPAEVLAARFCAECDTLVTVEHHLVLDDYHEAMDSGALNDVLGYLFENCPGTVHFIVLTRYEPNFRLEKLHLSGEASRLPRETFLFDEQQVAEVLEQRSGRAQHAEHVRSLFELTEGWPASVVLAGMALNWLDVASLEEALADPRLRGDVFSYLAEQVFQRQSEDVRRFLLGTCCLDHVTGELGEVLTGSAQASRRLHYLARNQIFTFPSERAGAYRYHNLLRDFLRQRFVQDEGKAAFRGLQRASACALEDSGDRPGAVELLLAANELELALGAIARGGESLLERRPYEQLRNWVQQLEPLRVQGQPWALVTSGVLDAREGRFDRSLSCLRAAVAKLEGGSQLPWLYQVLSITEWAEFWSGDSAASMRTSRRALKTASNDGQRLHTLLSLLSAGVDMRRWDVVEEASKEAAMLLPGASERELARAQALEAHAAFYRGEVRNARMLMLGIPHTEETVSQRAAALNTLGMIDLALGDYAAAGQDFGQALEIAADFGRTFTSHIHDNVSYLNASLGRYEVALASLDRLLTECAALDPTMLCSVLLHIGVASRWAGKLDTARKALRDAVYSEGARRDPYLAFNSRINLALSEGLMGAGRTSTLEQLASDASRAGLIALQLKATLFVYLLNDLNGNQGDAVNGLDECLSRQLRMGHLHTVTQELSPFPMLIQRVLERQVDEGFASLLVDALRTHWRYPRLETALQATATPEVLRLLRGEGDDAAANAPLATQGTTAKRHEGSVFLESESLTARELQVLKLMAEDRSNAEIAGELFIALSTVKTHVNHILRKLDQKTRIGAILEYQRLMAESPPASTPRIHPRYDSSEDPRD